MAVCFPHLALDALGHSARSRQALAVLDPEDRQQRVLACNGVARQRGVRAGQPLNAALAFDSTLVTLPRDAFREQRFLESIATHFNRFTPLVSVAGDDEVLLEVKGSVHLFGGAQGLMKQLKAELDERQIQVCVALTPTPRGALWMARREALMAIREASGNGSGSTCVELLEALPSQLSSAPLPCLRWPVEVLERLVNMGVRTVGDLMRLPRAGLARRIGRQWLEELDRAMGRSVEVRRRFEARERYDDAQALDCELETVESLKFVLDPLLERLQRFLRVREAALGSLVLELKHRTDPCSRLRIGLAAPSADVDHLRGLLQERLSSLALRAPVISVRLLSGAIRPAQPVSAQLSYAPGLAGQHASVLPDALPRLIERLQARLGRETIFGLNLRFDHRPELAWRAVQPQNTHPHSEQDTASAAGRSQATRPLWLMAEPRVVGFNTGQGQWRIESGPERIESGWWDGGDVARDYFIARDPRGSRCWVYRERRAPHRWFLHGLFG